MYMHTFKDETQSAKSGRARCEVHPNVHRKDEKNENETSEGFSSPLCVSNASPVFRQEMSAVCMRGNHNAASQEQLDCMADFMEAHFDLTKGHLKAVHGRQRTKELWAFLTKELNSKGPPVKSAEKWKKTWADYKYRLSTRVTVRKKQAAKLAARSMSPSSCSKDSDLFIITELGNDSETDKTVPESIIDIKPFEVTEAIPESGFVPIKLPILPPVPVAIQIDEDFKQDDSFYSKISSNLGNIVELLKKSNNFKERHLQALEKANVLKEKELEIKKRKLELYETELAIKEGRLEDKRFIC